MPLGASLLYTGADKCKNGMCSQDRTGLQSKRAEELGCDPKNVTWYSVQSFGPMHDTCLRSSWKSSLSISKPGLPSFKNWKLFRGSVYSHEGLEYIQRFEKEYFRDTVQDLFILKTVFIVEVHKNPSSVVETSTIHFACSVQMSFEAKA